MTSNWRDFEIHNEAGDERATFGEHLRAIRRRAATAPADALDEGIHLALGLHEAGLDREAMELLEELSTYIDPDEVGPESWAWFLNTRAMSLSGLGHQDKADADYAEMAELGAQVSDEEVSRDIVSTAQQNRGSTALEAGAPERAAALLREALTGKYELRDWLAAVDVLNSLALATAELGKLDDAVAMLADVERIAEEMHEPRRVAAAVGNRGIIRARRGDYVGAEADFRTTLAFSRREGDPYRELLGMMNVGSVLADQGRTGEALRWYRRAARLASERGTAAVEVRLRRSVALMLLRLGRRKDALAEMEHALAIAREIGHPQHTRECLADVGAMHAQLDDNNAARRELEDAQAAFARAGDSEWESRVACNLAEVAISEGRFDEAGAAWSRALALRPHDPHYAVDVAHRAAEAFALGGDIARAEHWVTKELSAAEVFEQGASLAWRTAAGGVLLNWRRRNEHGLGLLQRALTHFDALGESLQATTVRMDLATTLSDLGRHEDALTHIGVCLDYAAERSDRVLSQRALANRGEVLRRKGNHPEALRNLQEAVALARELCDDESLAHALGSLGLVEQQMGALDVSRQHYTQQLTIGRRLRDAEANANALSGLATIDLISGRYTRAVARYARAAALYGSNSEIGEVEALGGLLESLALAERDSELQAAAQELVNTAQATGLEDAAAGALARAARVLLRRDRQVAADFYSASLQVALVPTADPADVTEQASRTLAQQLGLLAAHVEVDVPEQDRRRFYDSVLQSLDLAESGLGKSLRPYLEQITDEFGKRGVPKRLREDDDVR